MLSALFSSHVHEVCRCISISSGLVEIKTLRINTPYLHTSLEVLSNGNGYATTDILILPKTGWISELKEPREFVKMV